ncbi:four helix bundle protein [Kordia algicida OT-1]|uniref:23S rRNA gene intervening sequence Orf n=1 Tax=Kordia algicida OT-1 TaxID=391587 RepID=A9DII2_9FLAO|nr:four helix bundle protein [Kordia algicida]EDP97907.1 23S rRNA gene intervening sequence Orf [Kordia algicida OT-1]
MDFQKLLAYQKSYDLAMQIFEISKKFPKEEVYSLTDQIRRSSRSITVNIAEAYRKRKYVKHFISKLTDADAENSETTVWLNFALSCEYITSSEAEKLKILSEEVGKLLNYMMRYPDKFGVVI